MKNDDEKINSGYNFYNQFGVSELLAMGWLDERSKVYQNEGLNKVEMFKKIKKEVEEKLKRPMEEITLKDLYDYLVDNEIDW